MAHIASPDGVLESLKLDLLQHRKSVILFHRSCVFLVVVPLCVCVGGGDRSHGIHNITPAIKCKHKAITTRRYEYKVKKKLDENE